MFRDRPLTWLFVIATVVVDVVMAATDKGSGTSVARLGFVIGQLAALAIWSVRGEIHRLGRVSCLIVVVGSIAFLIEVSSESADVWVAFYAGYVFVIALATLLGNLVWRTFEGNKSESSSKQWKIPLIEFFGWTTVVAIICFGARHMDFGFLIQGDSLLIVTALLTVPVSTALLIRHDLRDLRAVSAFVIVLAAIISAVYLSQNNKSGAIAIFVQTVYLSLWLAVLGMDKVKADVRTMHESLQEVTPPASQPKLFNPQD